MSSHKGVPCEFNHALLVQTTLVETGILDRGQVADADSHSIKTSSKNCKKQSTQKYNCIDHSRPTPINTEYKKLEPLRE